jgi:protein PET100
MAGPNLEVFKFTLYLFIPIAALVHFGDPDWYRQNVLPVCDQIYFLEFHIDWPRPYALLVSR